MDCSVNFWRPIKVTTICLITYDLIHVHINLFVKTVAKTVWVRVMVTECDPFQAKIKHCLFSLLFTVTKHKQISNAFRNIQHTLKMTACLTISTILIISSVCTGYDMSCTHI